MKTLMITIILFLLFAPFAFAQDCEFEVMTAWIGSGVEGDPNRPLIGNAYSLKRWEDITGQPSANIPTDPNQYVVKALALCTVLDDIELDERFTVLWAVEKSEDEFMPDVERKPYDPLSDQEKADKQTELKSKDIPDEQATVGSDTKKDHAKRIKAWLKTRPHNMRAEK